MGLHNVTDVTSMVILEKNAQPKPRKETTVSHVENLDIRPRTVDLKERHSSR
jgi:hypothetical protein